MVDEHGVRFGLASGGIVVALLFAGALRLDLGATAILAVLAAAWGGSTLPRLLAAALGAEAWAFFTGFFENRYGVLTFSVHDLGSLSAFAAVTVVLAQLLSLPSTVASGGPAHD